MKEPSRIESGTRDPGGFNVPRLEELPPADLADRVVEAYKRDVDRTLLRENLALTVEERLEKFERFMEFLEEVRESGRQSRVGPGGER